MLIGWMYGLCKTVKVIHGPYKGYEDVMGRLYACIIFDFSKSLKHVYNDFELIWDQLGFMSGSFGTELNSSEIIWGYVRDMLGSIKNTCAII